MVQGLEIFNFVMTNQKDYDSGYYPIIAESWLFYVKKIIESLF